VAEGHRDEPQRIETAFLLALGRPPKTREMDWSRDFLKEMTGRFAARAAAPSSAPPAEQQALAHLCHVLLNSSEFLYVP
jgi:hypothetical protein